MRDVVAPALFLVMGVACGGATAASDDGGSPGACTLLAGTYVEHFTLESQEAGCKNLPDQTLTLSSSETLTGPMTSSASGSADGGAECSITENAGPCTVWTICKTTENG